MKKIMIIVWFTVTIIFCSSISACTVFNYTIGEKTLVGRNMDWYTQENFIKFSPPEEGKFGRVYFGWNTPPSWYQGGMNSQGVMFAYLYAPYLRVLDSLLKPVYNGNYGNLMKKCMEECSSINDVLDIFDQYNLQFLENCHVMVVDRNGDSVIIGGDDITVKEGAFQVVTNFRPSHPLLGGYPCWRYNIAVDMIESMDDFSVEYFTEILNGTHQEGNYPTQWSIVYDLLNFDIHLYHYHDYENVITFNLLNEIEIGDHVYSIPALFEDDNNLPPYKPDKPTGETNGKIGEQYSYTASSTDSNGNDLYYQWDWGNEISDWIGPIESGADMTTSHTWDTEDEFEIKVKVKDIYGEESPWSDPLIVTMPKSNNLLSDLFLQFLKNHPLIHQILILFK
jgi:choloylglycine hydrolase